MRAPFAVLLIAMMPGAVLADPASAIAPPVTSTVQPPPGQPHAYTPAPVPNIGAPTVAPANRAGNATDAGPINATPLSASLSGSLGPGQQGRAQQETDPTADPVPSLAGHD